MSWLTPLGFLGLIGLAVLLLIYLLKPNYQQKSVSSTFVWKLSLKYKRRKNPISRLRNLLILLCQILIITGIAFVMAQPATADEIISDSTEKVLIIDASASMLASTDNETRFERAVREASYKVEEVLDAGGRVSVIIAGKSAEALAFRIDNKSEEADTIADDLLDLIEPNHMQCSYGSGDVVGAMNIAETVTVENPKAEVLFYTGTTYLNKGNVTVVDVSENGEWNVAILDARAEFNDGLYIFYVDVACYGRDVDVTVKCQIDGINYENFSAEYSYDEKLSGDRTFTIVFDPDDIDNARGIYQFKSAHFYVEINDSFLYDNNYYLYGGTRETVRIQYYSSAINPFYSDLLLSMANAFRDTWDLQVVEVRGGSTPQYGGFDFYIFEDIAPEQIPTDGVVMLSDINPGTRGLPLGFDDYVFAAEDSLFRFYSAGEHPILNYVNPANIGVTRYTRIVDWDTQKFSPLLFCDGDPVVLYENTPESKMIITAFSVHYSTITMLIDFPAFMYGIFQYYFPTTTDGYVFEVNEDIVLNARGASLTVSGPDKTEKEYKEFPATLSVDVSGTYTLTQTLISNKELKESIFVRVPVYESNIVKKVDVLNSPVKRDVPDKTYIYDILFWILGAVVVLLFAEWWLHSRAGV